MRSLVILKRAAYRMQEPVYFFGDDVKDFSNHFVHAAEVHHLMDTIFLDNGDLEQATQYGHEKGSLVLCTSDAWGSGSTRTPL